MAYAGGGIHLDFKEEPNDKQFDDFEEEYGQEIEMLLDKALGVAKVEVEKELKAMGLANKLNVWTEV